MVRGNWERNGTQLRDSDDDRITVNNVYMAVTGSPNEYESTIDFNPMTFGDNGIYRCSAMVSPLNSEFISEHATLASSQQMVYVQGMWLVCPVADLGGFWRFQQNLPLGCT